MKKKVFTLLSVLTMLCLLAIPSLAECIEVEEYEVCPVLRNMYGAESPEFLYGYSLREDKVHNFSITITDNDANIVPIFVHHEDETTVRDPETDPDVSEEPTAEPTDPEITTGPISTEPEVEEYYFVDCKTDWRNQVCSVISDIYGDKSSEFLNGYSNLPDETHTLERYISLINGNVYLVPSQTYEPPVEEQPAQEEVATQEPNESATNPSGDYSSVVGTTLDVVFNKTDMAISLILDNKNVKCDQTGIDLFKANNFDASIQGSNLVISKNYNITRATDELSKDFELIKQALVEINSALSSEVNSITMEAKVSNSGFPMVGVTIASFKFGNMPEFKVTASSDKLIYVGGTKIPIGEKCEFDGSEEFEFEVFNNANVSNIAIGTTISKDKVSSNIIVTFKEDVVTDISIEDIGDPRVSSFSLSSKSLNITYEYTSPDMFNSMHSHDLYNLFGGLYLVQLQDKGVYFKRGELEIRTVSNDGVPNVTYDVYYKDNHKGSATIEDGQVYNVPYSQVETGNLVVTLIVVLAIGFVFFGFYKLSKRK